MSEHTSQRLEQQQTDLERVLQGIGALFHTELEKNLDLLDSEVDQLFGAQSHTAPMDADLQRENAYATAVQCEQRLLGLSQSISSTLENVVVAPSQQGQHGQVTDILKILHKHQMQLAQLEHASRAIEHDVSCKLNVSLNQ